MRAPSWQAPHDVALGLHDAEAQITSAASTSHSMGGQLGVCVMFYDITAHRFDPRQEHRARAKMRPTSVCGVASIVHRIKCNQTQ